jgi:outer membrane protein OmpA-like peptidoglycan-associated protein
MKFLFTYIFLLTISTSLFAQIKEKNKSRVGLRDSDQDGVIDSKDNCPETPPNTIVDSFGCVSKTVNQLDSDKDGIPDYQDSCAQLPGIANLKGCPDYDGDGIADPFDKCPKQAGTIALAGCPDRDNDGISDEDDKCPDAFGLSYLSGCMDSDGDQIADQLDDCPNRQGKLSNKGCPEIDKELSKILLEAQVSIQFSPGSSKISSKSSIFMQKLIEVMQKNQDMKFSIYCFTQESKVTSKNDELAMNRAAEIEAFLISKGVYSKRLSFKSYHKSDRTLTPIKGINNQTIIEPKFINP